MSHLKAQASTCLPGFSLYSGTAVTNSTAYCRNLDEWWTAWLVECCPDVPRELALDSLFKCDGCLEIRWWIQRLVSRYRIKRKLFGVCDPDSGECFLFDSVLTSSAS